MVEYLQRDRVFAGDHLIEHLARRAAQIGDIRRFMMKLPGTLSQ